MQTFVLSPSNRPIAHNLIECAPDGYVLKIGERKRSNAQNDKMWAMISDISRAKPEGRLWVPETWKCGFMHHLGHQVQFCEGLDNTGPFPMGFRSSRLNKSQMADLITCIQEYGDRHDVVWSNEGLAA